MAQLQHVLDNVVAKGVLRAGVHWVESTAVGTGAVAGGLAAVRRSARAAAPPSPAAPRAARAQHAARARACDSMSECSAMRSISARFCGLVA